MGNKPVKQKDEVLVKIVPPLDQSYLRWLARDLERIHGFVPRKPRAIKPPDHFIEYMQMSGWLDLDLNDPDLAHLFKFLFLLVISLLFHLRISDVDLSNWFTMAYATTSSSTSQDYWPSLPSSQLIKDTVMSDFEDSTVTCTVVSILFGGLSDIGSPGVNGPPVMPEDPYAYVVAAFQAPPSPDYVSGPEYPPLPEFVPEPVYPEFMPPEDDVLPAEEHPLPAAASPTADSPCYVPKSDPEEDPNEDDDEDPKEDPVDYPIDRENDGDDEDESSDDDDVDIEGDDEEEEHPAPADSTVVALPSVEHAPSAEETEPFETDESAATPPPHPAYRVTARISIRDEPPTPFWSDTEVARLLAIPTPPPSPLSLWSSPLPQIPSPPLPPILSPLLVSSPPPASPTYPLGYRSAMIRLRAEAPSTSHSPPPHIILSHTRAYTPPSGTPPLLPIPLPTSSPHLHLPSADHEADRPEVCLPPRKRLCIALGPRDIGYGITDTWDEMLVDMPGAPTTDDTELGRQITEFAARVTQDTNEIYVRLGDEQTERQLMAEDWGRSMDASDFARSEVMSLRTTVLGQQAVITELQAADRRRQAQFIKALKLLKGL
ncbi:hypothetical protein Tco_1017729 [Tanacetum coccineum]|uniref:Uncharacterized protein n=1 Tax=Tanacetum coccineum TaxID=301880 RepID=A0ABQ5FSQ2_9ASTR